MLTNRKRLSVEYFILRSIEFVLIILSAERQFLETQILFFSNLGKDLR